uniref:BTB domain-containing protein n=1 Tax=Plectus sambesii TaxID=2011161 RepID=A0A914VWN8_9BILA
MEQSNQECSPTDQAEYNSFGSRSEFCDFKLKVAGTSFFVNPWYLAEKSPVFATLCLNHYFKEKAEKTATIQEENSEDILELLRCICPSSPYLTPKPVTAENFGILIRLADKFDVIHLRAACEKYLNEEFDYIEAEPTYIIQMLIAADQFRLNKDVVAKLITRVATFDIDTLKMHELHKILSNYVVAALFTANANYKVESKEASSVNNNQGEAVGSNSHLFLTTDTGEQAKFNINCTICQNSNGLGTYSGVCMKCCKVLCSSCESGDKCSKLVMTPAQLASFRTKLPVAEVDLSMLE